MNTQSNEVTVWQQEKPVPSGWAQGRVLSVRVTRLPDGVCSVDWDLRDGHQYSGRHARYSGPRAEEHSVYIAEQYLKWFVPCWPLSIDFAPDS